MFILPLIRLPIRTAVLTVTVAIHYIFTLGPLGPRAELGNRNVMKLSCLFFSTVLHNALIPCFNDGITEMQICMQLVSKISYSNVMFFN